MVGAVVIDVLVETAGEVPETFHAAVIGAGGNLVGGGGDDGAEQQWQALDVVLEEDNPNAWRTETAKVTLLGEDAKLALVPGMEVEVTLFLSTRMHDNKIYNEVLYKSLKVLS